MYDIYGLGNALVDMEYPVDDAFLHRHGLAKGHVALIDEARLDALIADLPEAHPHRASGGSAANTVVAVQGFGGSGYYAGKVADDATGRYFLNEMAEFGIATNAAVAATGVSGCCLVLVTEDAERTMGACLGVSGMIHSNDIDEAALADSKIFYIEGYLSAAPDGLATASTSRQFAEQSGVATAVTMSDVSIVTAFRDQLQRLLGNGVNHLFCNEEEALSWARTDRMDIAIAELKDIARRVNVTLGSRGSMSVQNGKATTVPGYPANARDTTGAGDIYAGACLYGLAAGMAAPLAARLGNHAAAALVRQYGARLRRIEHYQQVLRAFQRSAPPPELMDSSPLE